MTSLIPIKPKTKRIGTMSGNNLTAIKRINQCRKLWQIERGFRTNKHDLSVRPIFH